MGGQPALQERVTGIARDFAKGSTKMQKRKVKPEAGATETTGKPPARKMSSKESAARSIGFVVMAPDAKAVSIVGEFNDWSIGRHPLQKTDSEAWHITLQLLPGTSQYTFVIDGIRWEDDADNPKRALNEFGTTNSILEVG